MLASACGWPQPRCQVRPVRRSYTAASAVPARPDRYEAAAGPNGSRRPATPAGAARGEGLGEECARRERADGEGPPGEGLREGTEEVTFSRAAAGSPGAPGVRAGLPEPVAARAATVPAAMATQAPSATSTTRTGARCDSGPEPACLPFGPETDVLTTIPIVSLAGVRPAGPGES